MKLGSLKKLGVVALSLMCLLGTAACGKQTASKEDASKFPSRSIKMLVPWSAGGGSDIAVRTLVPYLEKNLGAQITVVNMTGANGWVAWKELAKSAPDGYTIAQMNIPTVYSGYLDPQQKRKENLDSFRFVANEISDDGCLVVSAKNDKFKDLPSFIEYAKNDEVLAGDNGVGTNKHLLAVALNEDIKGLKIKYVHQAGWSDTYSALLGGHVDVGWGSVGETLQGYKDGEVKVLCVFANKRSPLMPNVPTFNELMPGYNITSPSDRGFALPKGVDDAIYNKWVDAMNKSINDPEFKQKMEALGQSVNYMGGQEYTDYVKKEEGNMKKFAKILGWEK